MNDPIATLLTAGPRRHEPTIPEAATISGGSWHVAVSLRPVLDVRILHEPTGYRLADAAYQYEVTLAPELGGLETTRTSTGVDVIDYEVDEDDDVATLRVLASLCFPQETTGLAVIHELTIRKSTDRIEERIALGRYQGDRPHQVASYRFGFQKVLLERPSGRWRDAADRFRLTPVPLRRYRGLFLDYGLEDYRAPDLIGGGPLPHGLLAQRPSEAWAWGDGEWGVLISKYSSDHIEFSAVNTGHETSPTALHLGAPTNSTLAFGGAAVVNGAPGGRLEFDSERRLKIFGTTTIEAYRGDWPAAYAAYKRQLGDRGHALRTEFDPPVHWNELYNLGWRGGKPLQEAWQLWQEAEYAKEIGAQALYFDPGWDLHEGSWIWDAQRLGPLNEVVSRLEDEYGLSLSLHLIVHPATDAGEDLRMFRQDRDGRIASAERPFGPEHWVCTATREWQDSRAERVLGLAREGVKFFMFDFNGLFLEETRTLRDNPVGITYDEPCWAADHGHHVPLTLEEHSAGIIEVIRRLKSEFPDVIVEAHDRITSGLCLYQPLYHEHESTTTFDENWGFEYMWDPYADLLSGRALSLYEYNLAYDIPLYLHIDVGKDNERALAFWWYASTCRHLGIGGITPSSPNWATIAEAMKDYRRLKPHFASGRFIGLDPLVHVHIRDGERTAVLLAFNLGSESGRLETVIRASDLGLPDGCAITVDSRTGLSEISLEATIPPQGVALIELSWA